VIPHLQEHPLYVRKPKFFVPAVAGHILGHFGYYHKWNFAPRFKMKLPIPLSPAKSAMEDAMGPISNVPYCVVRI
jgi:hypothetical protein